MRVYQNTDPAKFNYVGDLNENLQINTVEENIKNFLDYGLLSIGGFININVSGSGLYNSTLNRLKPNSDPAYKPNTVWQTSKADWVWETGISYTGYSPVNISGIKVNNVFYAAPTGSGSLSYSLDYANGMITFSKAQTSTAVIEMNYSYKWCKVLKASDTEGSRVLQLLSYKSLNDNTKIDANHNITLPCMIVESIPRNKETPYELGSLISYRQQDILIHIYTELDAHRKNLMDILRLQKEKSLLLFDINKVVNSGVYGLLANGNRNPSGLNYGQIVSNPNYVWNTLHIKDVNFVEFNQNPNSSFFWCIVRLTTETIY